MPVAESMIDTEIVKDEVGAPKEPPPDFFPDYVLVRHAELDTNPEICEMVETFEDNLQKAEIDMKHNHGLDIIQRVEKVEDGSERVFVLISIKDELLKSYAEALRIRLPIERKG